jgi:predicted CoA-binding protein
MDSKNTLVLGASKNPQRYSYLAMHKLKAYGHRLWQLEKERVL